MRKAKAKMKLLDLDPKWTSDAPQRHGMGVSFICPAHYPRMSHRLAVFFENPIDGGPASAHADKGHLWKRVGTYFSGLTLTPSIDASAEMFADSAHPSDVSKATPCWHGFITDGEIK